MSLEYSMRFLALLVFLLASCSSGLTNTIDNQKFVCGEGYEAGKSYIKVTGATKAQDLSLVSFPKSTMITKKGCVERPKSGEVFVTNLERTAGVWLNPGSGNEIALEPLKASTLPSACNSVVHGDGRGFTLNFDLAGAVKSREMQTIEVKLLSFMNGDAIATWPSRPLTETTAFAFNEGKPVLSGEYRLLAEVKDGISGALSKSECTLRIDYSELLISPAESVKTKRVYNGQEVLLVQPGYNVNFYVHEGFRDVSIEYCLKQVKVSEVSQMMNPDLLKCESTLDFSKTKSPSMDSGFWVLNYRGQRGLVQNNWQHAVFMVDKLCVGNFHSPVELAGRNCTTIRGGLDIGLEFMRDDIEVLNTINVVFGDVIISSPALSDVKLLPNLQEIYGNLDSRIVLSNHTNAFHSLESIWGNLDFQTFWKDAEYTAFESLRHISGDIKLSNIGNDNIVFPLLQIVEGEISIENSDRSEFNYFGSLELAGSLDIKNSAKLKNF
ncbi:MAG: hypothetical protein EOP04_10035 [Proteobacteria bacterium]|nr:MAG: hypothetical protein EOP04_10035 [Pseudomonadota bacterium]